MLENTSYKFEIVKAKHNSIIKVIGIGGGGSNAVTTMYNKGIRDVEFVVCNTDSQALEGTPIEKKLQIGLTLTEGLGAGANPEVGKNAAIESKEEIKTILEDSTKMLFITAGMGGGTGTGAAPVIANIAKKLGILTVGIVTLPFSFEGKKKRIRAEEGIKELKDHCDKVLVILNDRLKDTLGNLSIGQAFAQADNVLTTAAKSIAEIITVPGYVNVDFEDVKTVIKDAGAAVMGSGIAEGENRAYNAAKEALTSPLLDYKDIQGAQKILLSIVSGPDAELQMNELTEITDFIQEQVGIDAELIFGHGNDDQLGEQIRVTVIATGFKKINSDDNVEVPQINPFANRFKQKAKAKKFPDSGSSSFQKSLFDGDVYPRERSVVNKSKSAPLDDKHRLQKDLIINNENNVLGSDLHENLKIPTFMRQNIDINPLNKNKSPKVVDLYENCEDDSNDDTDSNDDRV